MVYHIFIDSSISESKIREESQFLSYLFCRETWYTNKIKASRKALFGMTAEQALLEFQLLNNAIVLLDPLESTQLSKMKLPHTVEGYKDWVLGACDAITIQPTNLVQMDGLRSRIANPEETTGSMIVASNNVRYAAYKDYKYTKLISREGLPPEILLRKAMIYALNCWFGTLLVGKEGDEKKFLEKLRSRIISAYLLGATE